MADKGISALVPSGCGSCFQTLYLSPIESLCTQHGALLEVAGMLGFVRVGGLGFRRGMKVSTRVSFRKAKAAEQFLRCP